jgi:hypothetical protein
MSDARGSSDDRGDEGELERQLLSGRGLIFTSGSHVDPLICAWLLLGAGWFVVVVSGALTPANWREPVRGVLTILTIGVVGALIGTARERPVLGVVAGVACGIVGTLIQATAIDLKSLVAIAVIGLGVCAFLATVAFRTFSAMKASVYYFPREVIRRGALTGLTTVAWFWGIVGTVVCIAVAWQSARLEGWAGVPPFARRALLWWIAGFAALAIPAGAIGVLLALAYPAPFHYAVTGLTRTQRRSLRQRARKRAIALRKLPDFRENDQLFPRLTEAGMRVELLDEQPQMPFSEDIPGGQRITVPNEDEFDFESLNELANLTRPTDLRLYSVALRDEHLRAIGGLSNLFSLTIQSPEVTDAGLAFLARQTGLRELTLSETSIRGTGLCHLHGCTRLDFIDLSKTRLDDEGAKALAPFRAVSSFSCDHTRIADASLDSLRDWSRLEVLSVQGTRVKGPGLKSLAGCRRLRILDLSDCPIDDDGLILLPSLTALVRLHLQGTAISDRGLVHLAQLPNLRELDLSYTRVGNAGLASIERLRGRVWVDLTETRVTSGVAEDWAAETESFWKKDGISVEGAYRPGQSDVARSK